MLVASKKSTDVIGDAIEIVILGISRGEIKVGISAPPEMKILRQELQADSAGGCSVQYRLANRPQVLRREKDGFDANADAGAETVDAAPQS